MIWFLGISFIHSFIYSFAQTGKRRTVWQGLDYLFWFRGMFDLISGDFDHSFIHLFIDSFIHSFIHVFTMDRQTGEGIKNSWLFALIFHSFLVSCPPHCTTGTGSHLLTSPTATLTQVAPKPFLMPKSCWCVGAVPQNNTVSRGDFRAQSHSRLNDGISSTQNIWVLPWTRFIYVLDAVSSYNNKCENHFSHSSVHLSSLSEKSSPFPCFAYSTQVLRHAGLPFVMWQRTKIWKSPKILNIYFNDLNDFICFDTFWTLFIFF